ncbi:MAG: hypothetical protein ACM31L_11005 [Actinomycetota bacterium]
MLRRLFRLLFPDRRARRTAVPAAAPAPVRRAPPPPRERTPAQALAEAEERMARLPPEKAQLIRTALLVQKATRDAAMAELTDEQRQQLATLAKRTFGA